MKTEIYFRRAGVEDYSSYTRAGLSFRSLDDRIKAQWIEGSNPRFVVTADEQPIYVFTDSNCCWYGLARPRGCTTDISKFVRVCRPVDPIRIEWVNAEVLGEIA